MMFARKESAFPPADACWLVACLLSLSAIFAGCSEPNYRNEVAANAQGGVEVHRVPKDVAPASPAVAADAPKPTAVRATNTNGQSIDEQIAHVQSQINQLNAELTKLQLQKAASQTP
jgi:hypothetical protein